MRILIVALALLTALATPGASPGAAPAAAAVKRIAITVTDKGFEPATIRLEAGRPVTLVVTRKTGRTCATEIVIRDYGIRKPLPLDQPVEIRFTPKHAGTVRYACGMDMIAGRLVVE